MDVYDQEDKSADCDVHRDEEVCHGIVTAIKDGGSVGPQQNDASIFFNDQFYNLETEFCDRLLALNYNSVACVYNPIHYARDPHKKYLQKYCSSYKSIIFLGMNPGPNGMCQTGVPFGEITRVRDWLKISGVVETPNNEHPSRRITGFQCSRKEVSGARLWNLIQDICGDPETFFTNCFVHNYCPLGFLDDSGRNVTPPTLPLAERKHLMAICDEFLLEVLKFLRVEIIVAIGNYARDRATRVVAESNTDVRVVKIMHPSPLNRAAHVGWKENVTAELESFGITKLMKNEC